MQLDEGKLIELPAHITSQFDKVIDDIGGKLKNAEDIKKIKHDQYTANSKGKRLFASFLEIAPISVVAGKERHQGILIYVAWNDSVGKGWGGLGHPAKEHRVVEIKGKNGIKDILGFITINAAWLPGFAKNGTLSEQDKIEIHSILLHELTHVLDKRLVKEFTGQDIIGWKGKINTPEQREKETFAQNVITDHEFEAFANQFAYYWIKIHLQEIQKLRIEKYSKEDMHDFWITELNALLNWFKKPTKISAIPYADDFADHYFLPQIFSIWQNNKVMWKRFQMKMFNFIEKEKLRNV